MSILDRTVQQEPITWGTMRYHHEDASLQLTHLGKDVYLLASLWTEPAFRRHGLATTLLRQITKMADERGMTLLLYVAPFGSGEPGDAGLWATKAGVMDSGALKGFYFALGWVVDDPRDPIRMVRRPNREKNNA